MPTTKDDSRLARLVERINSTSSAGFMRRLPDGRRNTLRNADGTVSTQGLGYVTSGDYGQGGGLARAFGDGTPGTVVPVGDGDNAGAYRRASEAYARARDEFDEAEAALRAYQDSGAVDADTFRRLSDRYREAQDSMEDAKAAHDEAGRALGRETLDRYRGTRHDLLRVYKYFTPTREETERMLVNGALRESAGAQEVADWFNSYGSSPGIGRIIGNQEEWWEGRHPYRKAVGTGLAMSQARRLRSSLVDDPMTSEGVFDLNTYFPSEGVHFWYPWLTGSVVGGVDKGDPRSVAVGMVMGDAGYWDTLAHEMMHGRNYVGGAQGEALDMNTETAPGHDSLRSEKHSNLEALRFLMSKEGIYDSRGDRDCTPEDVAEMRRRHPELMALLQMTDEQAAWMLNHVAVDNGIRTEGQRLREVPYANLSAYGGTLLRKYDGGGNLFHDGGDTDPDGQTDMPAYIPMAGMWDPGEAASADAWALPVPYEYPDTYSDGSIVGVENITKGVREGWNILYDKDYAVSGAKLYQDGNGEYYRIADTANVKRDGLTEIPYSVFRKVLPKRDYIGGKDDRIEAVRRIPGFTEKVYERAKAYGVDPNVVLRRFMKEGYIDQILNKYNHMINTDEQQEYWHRLWDGDRMLSGYGSLGLDYIGDELKSGRYKLLDENAGWRESEWSDEEGGKPRSGVAANPYGLSSAIEIMAAALKYRQDEAKKRYGVSDADLGIYANAAFNMGLGNSKMSDPDYVRRTYSYPDYYGQYGLKYSDGGKVLVGREKLVDLARRLQEAGYEFADGGKIHIKPENRGKFTSLKERTGHSATWFKENGTPAQNAINAAKKHGTLEYAQGGNLFWPGGHMNLTPYLGAAAAECYRMLKDVLSGDPEKQRQAVEKYHENADKIPPKVHSLIYDVLKNSAFKDDALSNIVKTAWFHLTNDNFWFDFSHHDNVFLMSPAQQAEELAKLGYKSIDTDDGYGLVNAAVNRYKEATGRDVPMYQFGNDDIERKDVIPIDNDILNFYYTNPTKAVKDEIDEGLTHFVPISDIGDTASTPTRLYRDKDGQLYFKKWDFFDHGDYSRNTYKGGDSKYIRVALESNSQIYGNLLDVAGNPFVKVSGILKYPNQEEVLQTLAEEKGYGLLFPNLHDEDAIKMEELKTRIKNGEFDIKANGGLLHKYDGDSEPTGQMSIVDEQQGDILNRSAKRLLFGKKSNQEIAKNLYENLRPHNYFHHYNAGLFDLLRRVRKAANGNTEYVAVEEDIPEYPYDRRSPRDQIFAEYLGIPVSERYKPDDNTYIVEKSIYTPTKNGTENNYYSLKNTSAKEDDRLIEDGLKLQHGESALSDAYAGAFNEHTVSRGVDPQKGDYVSYYDLWDINPFYGRFGIDDIIAFDYELPKIDKRYADFSPFDVLEDDNGKRRLNLKLGTEYKTFHLKNPLAKKTNGEDMSLGIGKPLHFYDRIYLDDYYGVSSKPEDGSYYGGYLQPATVSAKRADGGFLKDYRSGGLLKTFDEGGDTDDEYYGGDLSASSISSRLPSINTAHGKRIAKNMAERIASGQMSMSDVPDRYKAYVEGEVKGAMPVREAINTNGVKTALGTFAVPATVIGAAELGAAIATNPILRTAFDVVGTADGIRNAASDNGVKKTVNLIKDGDYGRALLSGVGDVFDIAGGVGLAGDVYRYGKGVLKRGAEAVLRMGDVAANIGDLKRQFGNSNTLNYIFNPFADKKLAYSMPFKYSGEDAMQEIAPAHFGDVVDQYLGKTEVPDATYDQGVLPEYLQDYIQRNYPNKKIPIRDLGNAGDMWQEITETVPGQYLPGNAAFIQKDGVSVLDPGGFVSQVVERIPNGAYSDITLKNWDIWKFNDKDYVSRHSFQVGPKDFLRRMGLKFLDSQGTPIVHTWTSHGGFMHNVPDMPPAQPVSVNISGIKANGGQINRFDAGGFIQKYGVDKVREALLELNGQYKFNGET